MHQPVAAHRILDVEVGPGHLRGGQTGGGGLRWRSLERVGGAGGADATPRERSDDGRDESHSGLFIFDASPAHPEA